MESALVSSVPSPLRDGVVRDEEGSSAESPEVVDGTISPPPGTMITESEAGADDGETMDSSSASAAPSPPLAGVVLQAGSLETLGTETSTAAPVEGITESRVADDDGEKAKYQDNVQKANNDGDDSDSAEDNDVVLQSSASQTPSSQPFAPSHEETTTEGEARTDDGEEENHPDVAHDGSDVGEGNDFSEGDSIGPKDGPSETSATQPSTPAARVTFSVANDDEGENESQHEDVRETHNDSQNSDSAESDSEDDSSGSEDESDAGPSEYELLRLRRIQRNQDRLRELGLLDESMNSAKKKSNANRQRKPKQPEDFTPSRTLPKREARTKAVVRTEIDIRTMRASHRQHTNRCGKCSGCTREEDCNSCVYCIDTNSHRGCLFKTCRGEAESQQTKSQDENLVCDVCKDGKDLIVCKCCKRGYHSNCHVPRIRRFPEDDWLCMECVDAGYLFATLPAEPEKLIKVKITGPPAPSCSVCAKDCSILPRQEPAIQCMACDSYSHISCHNPPLEQKPRGNALRTWRCTFCVQADRPILEHNIVRTKRAPNTPKKKVVEIKNLFKGEHMDDCYICMNGGELVCCDFCPKVFHLGCHIPALPAIPTGIWKCCECYAMGRNRMTRCGECKACHAKECGKCQFCLDRPKYGGPNKLKKSCMRRECPFQSYAETYVEGRIPGEMTPGAAAICKPVGTKKHDREEADEGDNGEPPAKKKRGRPLGSKNKPKPDPQPGAEGAEGAPPPQDQAEAGDDPEKKRRGRPPGSVKIKSAEAAPKENSEPGDEKPPAMKKRGRSPGTAKKDGEAAQPRKAVEDKNESGDDQPQKKKRRGRSPSSDRKGKTKQSNASSGASRISKEKSEPGDDKAPAKKTGQGKNGRTTASRKSKSKAADDNDEAERIVVKLKIPKSTDPVSVKVRKIINSARKNIDEAKTQQKACEHLRKHATSIENINRIILAGGIEMIARAMKEHPSKKPVQTEARATIAEMVRVKPEIEAKLSHVGIYAKKGSKTSRRKSAGVALTDPKDKNEPGGDQPARKRRGRAPSSDKEGDKAKQRDTGSDSSESGDDDVPAKKTRGRSSSQGKRGRSTTRRTSARGAPAASPDRSEAGDDDVPAKKKRGRTTSPAQSGRTTRRSKSVPVVPQRKSEASDDDEPAKKRRGRTTSRAQNGRTTSRRKSAPAIPEETSESEVDVDPPAKKRRGRTSRPAKKGRTTGRRKSEPAVPEETSESEDDGDDSDDSDDEMEQEGPILVKLKIPKAMDEVSVKVRKIINSARRNIDDSKTQHRACEHLRKHTSSIENIDKIILAGGIEMIARAMKEHPNKTLVQAEACLTIAEMAWVNPEIGVKLFHAGINDLIVSCMDRLKKNGKVQKFASMAFSALSESDESVMQ